MIVALTVLTVWFAGLSAEASEAAIQAEIDSVSAVIADSLLKEIPKAENVAHSAKIGFSYDKFYDRTTLTASPIKISPSVMISLSSSTQGRAERMQPGSTSFLISSKASKTKYMAYRDVVLLVDDSIRVQAIRPTYVRELSRGSVLEHIGFRIAFSTIVKLSKSKSLALKIGGDEFYLSNDNRAAILDYATRFGPLSK